MLDDIWPKKILGAKAGSLVKRSLCIGELGRLFMPDATGVVLDVEFVNDELIYSVLFFSDNNELGTEPNVLRLYDEDLILVMP